MVYMQQTGGWWYTEIATPTVILQCHVYAWCDCKGLAYCKETLIPVMSFGHEYEKT